MFLNSIAHLFLSLVFICSLGFSIQSTSQCDLSYSTIWSFPYSSAPFLSSPLLCHLDRDSLYDIVTVSSSGEVFGIKGQNGEVLNNWPLYINESEYLSSPLLVDFNRDGLDDIVLASEEGNIHYVSSRGEFFDAESYRIPNLAFSRYWYDYNSVDRGLLFDYYSKLYISEQNMSPLNMFNKYIPLVRTEKIGIDPYNSSIIYLQPHIHTTPLLEYLMLEADNPSLFVPVSFYIVSSVNQDLPGLTVDELNDYLVEAIIILDPFLKTITNFKIISIDKMDSENTSIFLSRPTVLNMLESSDRSLIIPSTSGDIYKLSLPDLTLFKNFPLETGNPISDTPIFFDNNGDGSLEIFTISEEGEIFCFDHIGQKLWSLSLETKLPPGGGMRMADIQGPTLITATLDGLLYAVNPMTGDILRNYPISTQVSLTGAPTLVSISPNLDPIWVLLSNQGDLVVHSSVTQCISVINGDHSFISTNSLMYHKLIHGISGMELIVTSSEGYLSVLSLYSVENDLERNMDSLVPWVSQMVCHMQNVQRNLSISVYLTSLSVSNSLISSYKQIFMNTYNVQYIINDNSIFKKNSVKYWIEGKVGEKTLFSRSHLTTGFYSENFDIPYVELQTTFTLFLRNKHGLCDYFQFPISMNCHWKDFLKWLLVIPFFGMNVIILFLHLETESLLPRYLPTK